MLTRYRTGPVEGCGILVGGFGGRVVAEVVEPGLLHGWGSSRSHYRGIGEWVLGMALIIWHRNR